MNPLTLVKRIQSINSKEATLGISEEASWHAKYKDSAYVFVGGIPFELTEGDLLAVFAQYGEVVDVNLVRDKGTGKSKGFAFLAYEDQRSTILAVDNLNGAQVSGRTIRVDHVTNYKKKEEEDEEAEQQKREARGVCRAFQKGECTRGAGCKFSHNEQRAANTGWGAEDNRSSKWGHDRFDAPKETEKRPGNRPPFREPESSSRARPNERASENYHKNGDKTVEKRSGRYNDNEFDPKPREDRHRAEEKRSRRYDSDELEPKLREGRMKEERRPRKHNDDDLELKPREDHDRREQKKPIRHNDREFESKPRDDRDDREGKRPRRLESDSYTREDRDKRGGDKQASHDKDSFSHRRRER